MWTQRFAVAVAASTAALLLLGGLVHSTGSGLACPDWPTCYGSYFPEMTGGVEFEHTHRVVGTLVGLLTIGLLVASWRRPGFRAIGVIALVAVVVQGVLGGLTVLWRLPPAVTSSHLGLGMAFFGLMLATVLWARRPSPEERAAPPAPRSVRTWLAVAVGVTYVQLILGAAVRHTGASLVCTDVLTCRGAVWPTDAPGLVHLHMTHRLMALVAAAVIAYAAILARRRIASGPVRGLALAAKTLVLVQIVLGFVTVVTFLNLAVVMGHLAIGTALWGVMVAMLVRASPRPRFAREGASAGGLAGELPGTTLRAPRGGIESPA